jgi:hypothetical protein
MRFSSAMPHLPIECHNPQAFLSEPIKPMIDTVIMSQSIHCYISQSDKGEIVLGSDPDLYPTYAQRGMPLRLEDVASQAIGLEAVAGGRPLRLACDLVAVSESC